MGDRAGDGPRWRVPSGRRPYTVAVPEVRLPGPRSYPGLDGPEHARRLLRRAENPDRPGAGTLRRLSSSRGYGIERMPELPWALDQRIWCSVYEHAFLLDDESVLCLYELEHDFTPGRRLVCEVYSDEPAACEAARRHARAFGGAGMR
ncbi:hypothetical protein GCM10009716_05250 [Streptomyces sodiiphilus]|uniref:Uncharacterized protein n=1 Tax=Streptomyces sodiiphilus TaxID=226217 RepID=A0ABN2NRA9_9ACTN